MTAEITPNANPVYAGALRRTGALIVDSIIGAAFCFLLIKVIGMGQAYNIAGQLAILVYYIAFESSVWQATPGKKLLGIYLTDTAGNRISPMRALARYLVFYAPGAPFIFLMFTDKFAAFDAGVQQVKQLSPDQQGAAMTSLLHENSALLGLFGIIAAGSLLVSAVLYWIPIIFTKQKTGLHDIVTHVRVVKKAKK